MVMFGNVKSKKRFMGLTSALEMVSDDPSRYDVVVDAASQLRSMLKGYEVSLTMSEKVRVIKTLSRAKVRAFVGGNTDNYRTYKTLDSISSDLVQML